MTTRFVRCRHCQVQCAYHPSGYTGPLNNDTYCPECWEKIEALLDGIPKKKQSIYIAADGISKVTLVEAESVRESMPFKVNRLIYSENMRILGLPNIKGESYQISVNTDDDSKLLEIECELDLETDKITGTWGCGDVSRHEFERSRSISKKFWSKNRLPKPLKCTWSTEVELMSFESEDILYQDLSFNTDEELIKPTDREIKPNFAEGSGKLVCEDCGEELQPDGTCELKCRPSSDGEHPSIEELNDDA